MFSDQSNRPDGSPSFSIVQRIIGIPQPTTCRVVCLVFSVMLVLLTQQVWGSCERNRLRLFFSGESTSDTTAILALTDRAYRLYSSQPDSSFYYATLADNQAQALQYDKGRGKALRVMGIYYVTKSNYMKALDYFEQALDYSSRSHDKVNMAGCYGNKGVVYRILGNYEKAIENQINSLRLREQIQDKKGIATAYNNIAVIYWEMGDSKRSLEYFQRSLEILQVLKDELGVASTYENIGRIYQEQGRKQEAIGYQKSAIEIQERLDDKRGLFISYLNLAELNLDLNALGEVFPYLQKAEAITQAIPSPERLSLIRKIQARYYQARGQLKEALRLIHEAQDLARDVGNREAYREATWVRYTIAQQQNDFKDALASFELFVALRDSTNQEKSKRDLAAREFALKEAQMLMEQEKKELQFRKEQDMQVKVSYSIGIVLVIFIILSVVVYRYISLKNKSAQLRIKSDFEVQLSQMQLKALQSQMNPHFIFNCLNSINHFILETKPAEASDYLAKFSKLIRLFMEEISDNNCTLSREQLMLRLYLELEKLRFGEKLSFSIGMEHDLHPDEVVIPSMVIQPFVENAIIHGIQPLNRNGMISIRFYRTSKGINCIVEDNGVGRKQVATPPTEFKRQSFGVNLCRQRLKLLQPASSIDIQDLVDPDGNPSGTKVHIVFASEYVQSKYA